jgi:hypothetical protein
MSYAHEDERPKKKRRDWRDARPEGAWDHGPMVRHRKYRWPDGSKAFTWEHNFDGQEWKTCKGCKHGWPLYWSGPTGGVIPDIGPIFIVEGEKAADRLWKDFEIPACASGGAQTWEKRHTEEIPPGREVVILRDNDEAGKEYADAVVAALSDRAANIKVVLLSGLGEKEDPYDYQGAREDLLAEVEAGEPARTLCEVKEGLDFERIYREIGMAICFDHVYTRGGRVVTAEHPFEGRDDVVIRQMTPADLLVLASNHVRYMVDGKRAPLPYQLMKVMIDRGAPELDELEGVIYRRTMRPDGSIFHCYGYDRETKLLLARGHNPDSEEGRAFEEAMRNPSTDDVATAVELLRRPFVDFPFDDPNGIAVPIAAIMSVVCRPAIVGNVPLFYFDAPTPGTGKGLLTDLVAIIATECGREGAPKNTAPTEETEWRKFITSIALGCAPMTVLDNCVGEVRSPALCAILTAGEHSDRILGRSETVRIKSTSVWSATGNNVRFGGDLPRRVVRSRLDSRLEHPEDRTGWTIPDVLGWTLEHREELAAAALTVVRWHYLAGSPAHGKPPLGSFEAWDRLIRGACIAAGLGDPDYARDATREEGDPDRELLSAMLEECYAEFAEAAFTVRELMNNTGEDGKAIVEAFAGSLEHRKVGEAIRDHLDRVVDGRRFVRVGRSGGQTRYRVAADHAAGAVHAVAAVAAP